MINFKELTQHRFFNTASSSFLILLYLYFLYNNVTGIRDGILSPTALIVIVMEAVVIFFLIIRTQPSVRATKFQPWFFAIAGTFLPLFFAPTGQVIDPYAGQIFVVIGGLLAITSYLSLNSSFGIAPAIRQVRTYGLYTFVRHPMYMSYIIMYIGYLNLAFSLLNLTIFITLFICLAMRTIYEEELLMQDEKYRAYSKKVTSRIIPYIF